MAGDDGFGPVMRSGAPSTAETSPKPGPRAAERGDEGFGPAMSGRSSRLRRNRDLPDVSGGRRGARRDGGDGRGPAPRGTRDRRPRRRRGLLRTALTLLLVMLLLGMLMSFGLLAYASSKIERVPVEGLQSAGATMNVLVVGSDSREGLTEEEVFAMGTGFVDGKRTDTIFVLSVRGQRAAMLSFPRDLFVTRCDGTQGRINSAFAAADGASCLTQTVSQVSGLPITHYMELNFLSFVNIVNALGGVEVDLEAPIRDVAAGIDLPAGPQELDGPTALGFVRARSIDDDLGRIGRQQYFLQQLARSAASPTTVLNPLRLVSTTGAVGDSLIADEGFGPIDMLRLGIGGGGLARGGLPTFTVPATPASIGGAAVLVPVEGEAAALFASFRDGSVFDVRPEEVPPEEVPQG
jgi:LCP family protein required for cell wall assembly